MKRSRGRGLLRLCGMISVLLHDIAVLYLVSLGIYLYKHIRLSFPEQIGQYLTGYTRQVICVLHLETLQIEINEPMSWIALILLAVLLIGGIAAGVWAIVGKASFLTLFDSMILLYLNIVWLIIMVYQNTAGGSCEIIHLLLQMPYLTVMIASVFCLIYLIAVMRRFLLLNSYWKKFAEESALVSTISQSKSMRTSEKAVEEQRSRTVTKGSWLKEDKEEAVQVPKEETDIRQKKRWRRRLALCSLFAAAAAGAAVYMGIVSYQKSLMYREMITGRAAQSLDIVPTLDTSEPSRLSRLGIVGYWYCVRVETADGQTEINDETGNLIMGLMEDHQVYLQLTQGSVWKRKQALSFMTGKWLYLDNSAIALDVEGMDITSGIVDGSLILRDGESTYYMEKEPDFSPSIVQQNMANAQMAVGTWFTENENSDISRISFLEGGIWKIGKESGIYIPEYGDRITIIDKDKEYYFDVANDKLEYYFICGQDSYQKEEEDNREETVSEEEGTLSEEDQETASETEMETTSKEEAETTGGVRE